MLWIPLTQCKEPISTASTQVQVQNLFYDNSDNCWEIRFMLSTQGASPAGLFFQPAVGAWNLFWYLYFSKSPSPSPHHSLAASEMAGPKDRGKHAYFFPRLIFPLSRNVCFTFQSLAIFSGQVHVLCIRNFVTWAWLIQTGKWRLLKIRGLREVRFSDISGHRSIRICIVRQCLFTIGDNRDYE